MGENTANGYFYKPALGANGASEKTLFDAKLDIADAEIKSNKDGLALRYLKTEIDTLLVEEVVSLLSITTVAFNADGDTTLYTVPTGKRCILSHAVIVAGADAGATTTISIGANGAETDFIPNNALSNLDAEYDVVIVRPIPNTTPLKGKSYAAATVIEARVATQSGVAGNTIYLFGILY